MKFRKDINGLRAFAVLAVMIYHFKPEWVPGGFAGVDVFFVISGYLMTGIIFTAISAERFNLLGFYVARINRIIPALTVLCTVLLIVGWFALVPIDYRTLGKHATSSLLFFSNVVYWLESGYFDVNSHEKLLLHTWSLSVEWQFYIIYPVLLLGLSKVINLNLLKKFIVSATIAFFFLNVFMTYRWPDAAYFLLPSRIWEMLLGGLAFLYPLKCSDIIKKIIEKCGLALILLSFFIMDSHLAWPGYYALLPVIGAYLIIIGFQNSSIATCNPLAQFVGKISYSIYLWHWPFVAFSYYYDISNAWMVGIPFSLVFGYLSYRYVELIHWDKIIEWKYIFKIKPLVITILIVITASYIYARNGVISRYPEERVALMNNLTRDIVMPLRENGYCFYSFNDSHSIKVDRSAGSQCFLGNTSKRPEVLIFGDSFAGQYDPFWKSFALENNIELQSVSTNWCFPSLKNNYTGKKEHIAFKQCIENRKFLKESLEGKKFKYLILASDWNAVYAQGYINDVEDVINLATKNNIKVILLSAPTLYRKNPLNKFQRYILAGGELNINDLEVSEPGNEYIKQHFGNKPNVLYIPKSDIFDLNGLFDKQNYLVPYSLDGMHISLIGSLEAYKHFKENAGYDLLRKYMGLMKEE